MHIVQLSKLRGLSINNNYNPLIDCNQLVSLQVAPMTVSPGGQLTSQVIVTIPSIKHVWGPLTNLSCLRLGLLLIQDFSFLYYYSIQTNRQLIQSKRCNVHIKQDVYLTILGKITQLVVIRDTPDSYLTQWVKTHFKSKISLKH